MCRGYPRKSKFITGYVRYGDPRVDQLLRPLLQISTVSGSQTHESCLDPLEKQEIQKA
jgi:hypothetical protein